MNTCVDCGKDYEYDANNPLGSSSVRCSSCRKKNTKFNRLSTLLEIAGHGRASCRMCGYHKSIHALRLFNSRELLFKPQNFEQEQTLAKTQYILCLNCDAQIKGNEVEVKVIDSKTYPVKVEFYLRNVVVMKERIEPQSITSDESEVLEIVESDPKEYRTVGGTAKRITNEDT